jgi:hypothetical protein
VESWLLEHLLITTLSTKSAQPTAKKRVYLSSIKFLHDMAAVSTGHCAAVYATAM